MLQTLILASLLRPTALKVTSVLPGETVRYPLLLLEGRAAGRAVSVGGVEFPVANGHFSAAVELKPGANRIKVQTGADAVEVPVTYVAMTTPYKVRAVYLLAQDEGTDYDGPAAADRTKWREKLDIALKMMQAATAESMREAGYGRKTFPLELGKDGKVVVHAIRTALTGDALRRMEGNPLWSRFYGELSGPFDPQVDRVCEVMAFTRWDRQAHKALAHTALGGGLLGLFGGGTLWSYPTTLADVPKVYLDGRRLDPNVEMDDSGLRGTVWANAATGLGAMLHEMGHTLGLPHSADGRSFMSRGFDGINRRFVAYEPPTAGGAFGHPVDWRTAAHWDPAEGARLNLSPWFQPDGYQGGRFPTSSAPTVSVGGASIRIDAPNGLGLVAAVREGKATPFREFKGERSARVARAEMGEGAATILAIDRYGNQTEFQVP